MIRTAFAQESFADAGQQWRAVADKVRERLTELVMPKGGAEADVLARMTFPMSHRMQIHSTNTLERLNAEI